MTYMISIVRHVLVLFATIGPVALHGQVPVAGRPPMPAALPSTLTMDHVVALAHRNKPDFLAARDNRRNALLELRSGRMNALRYGRRCMLHMVWCAAFLNPVKVLHAE